MFGVSEYITAGLATALLATGAWGKIQHSKKVAAIANLTAMEIQLKSCAGQITDIREDLESDNAIDSLSDSDLVNVPAEWLLGDSDSGN